ncbi:MULTISPECIES: ROK family glucokinase [Corynebacterium]|uniref:ROK family glucokinase n=1 Tax=Corynebacterium TaxID=1716 RepID=UPI00124D1D65|nr:MULTISPECIES: ROK family glucokinase [Corynebacterium]
MSATHSIGFDIGGTNLRGAVVTPEGRIIDSTQVPTPSTQRGLDEAIAYVVTSLRSRHDVGAVGLAVAGFIDPDCERVRFAPHLPWRDKNVRADIERLIDLPVVLEHDANAAAWGEYRFGAARDAQTWVLFAIGTGIGATLMHNGEIYRGAFGTAPEFGHITVVPDGRRCPCGKRGCLERYCSGTALPDFAKEIIGSGEFEDSSFVRRFRSQADELTGRRIMQAACNGDPAALKVVEHFSHWLGEGLAIVADILDPELIVVGGGVAKDSPLYLEAAKQRFARRIVGAGHRPLADIKTVELGSDAGMIGAADRARIRFLAPVE